MSVCILISIVCEYLFSTTLPTKCFVKIAVLPIWHERNGGISVKCCLGGDEFLVLAIFPSSLVSLDSVFWCIKVFHFDEVQFSIFSFVVIFKKPFPRSYFSLCFLLIILQFGLLNSGLLSILSYFLYMMLCKSTTSLFCTEIFSFPSTTWWKICPFPIE